MSEFKYTEYTWGHLIFLISFTLFAVIVFIANWVNYNNIDSDDDSVNIGVDQYTFTVFKIFNIILVFVCILALIYFIFKIFKRENVYTDLLPDVKIKGRTVSEIINGNSPEKVKEILKENECNEIGINTSDDTGKNTCGNYHKNIGNIDKVKFYLNQVRNPKINDDKAIEVIDNVCSFKEEPKSCIKRIKKIDETIKNFKQEVKNEILQLIPNQNKISTEKVNVNANIAVFDDKIKKIESEEKAIEGKIKELIEGDASKGTESLKDLENAKNETEKKFLDNFRKLNIKRNIELTTGTSPTSITTTPDDVEQARQEFESAQIEYKLKNIAISDEKSKLNNKNKEINIKKEEKAVYERKKEKIDDEFNKVSSKLNYLNKSLGTTPKKFEKYKVLYETV